MFLLGCSTEVTGMPFTCCRFVDEHCPAKTSTTIQEHHLMFVLALEHPHKKAYACVLPPYESTSGIGHLYCKYFQQTLINLVGSSEIVQSQFSVLSYQIYLRHQTKQEQKLIPSKIFRQLLPHYWRVISFLPRNASKISSIRS